MKKYILFPILLFVILNSGHTQDIKFSDIDTLTTHQKFGFDFIMDRACTTTTSNLPECSNHFYIAVFGDNGNHFDIRVPSGYAVKMGMVNLDSLKIAPPDSIFKKTPGRADSIPIDSLFTRIGHSYFIRTGRDYYDNAYFAKIRIMGLRFLDSTKFRVEMRFLWFCPLTSSKDLTTSGLDTFEFGTPVIAHKPVTLRKANHKSVFKVAGDRFIVPGEYIGSGAYLNVYDLAGKKLGRIAVGDRSQICLTHFDRKMSRVKLIKIE